MLKKAFRFLIRHGDEQPLQEMRTPVRANADAYVFRWRAWYCRTPELGCRRGWIVAVMGAHWRDGHALIRPIETALHPISLSLQDAGAASHASSARHGDADRPLQQQCAAVAAATLETPPQFGRQSLRPRVQGLPSLP